MMSERVSLEWLGPAPTACQWAIDKARRWHYLHVGPSPFQQATGYAIRVAGLGRVGLLLVGRVRAVQRLPWWGTVADVADGVATCTQYQVLEVIRIWVSGVVQPPRPPSRWRGRYYGPAWLPGYTDRRGVWRSTLLSTALAQLVARVGYDYLLDHPPCFPDEPWIVEWLCSYADPEHHRGGLYQQAGWEYMPLPEADKHCYRVPVPPLTPAQVAGVLHQARISPRSIEKRAARVAAQRPTLFGGL